MVLSLLSCINDEVKHILLLYIYDILYNMIFEYREYDVLDCVALLFFLFIFFDIDLKILQFVRKFEMDRLLLVSAKKKCEKMK